MEATLVKKEGSWTMDKSLDYMASLLRNGTYTVTIKRKVENRTIPQNALMWMWFQCLEDETGQQKEDWHDYYAYKYLSREVEVNNTVVRLAGRTSKLNTIQMTDFLNKVQADVATEWGIVLPLPSDKYYESFIEMYQHR